MRNRLVPNEWPWPLFRGRIKVMSTIALHSTLLQHFAVLTNILQFSCEILVFVIYRETFIKRIGSCAAKLQATHTSPLNCNSTDYSPFSLAKCFFSKSSKPNVLIFKHYVQRQCVLKRSTRIVDRVVIFWTVRWAFVIKKVPNVGRSAVTRNVSSPAFVNPNALVF